MIQRKYYKVVRVFPDPSSYFYIKNETMSETSILDSASGLYSTLNLEYSFDKVNWEKVTDDSWRVRLPADGYMYLRNTSGTFGKSGTSYFFPRVDISIGGDIRTLFNYTDVDSVTKIPDYGFSQPFAMEQRSKITDISNLSFRGITEIGNYGLQQAFLNNFTGTKGIDLRDVTTLGNYALDGLYLGSPNLTEVYAPNVETWNTSKTNMWLYNTSPSGVVYKPTNLTIPDGTSGIPSGWTTQDYPEE